MNLARFEYLQEFSGKKIEAETGPDLVGVGNKGPRGARDNSKQSWAKAHLVSDLEKKRWGINSAAPRIRSTDLCC
jgi:hypothetical protein